MTELPFPRSNVKVYDLSLLLYVPVVVPDVTGAVLAPDPEIVKLYDGVSPDVMRFIVVLSPSLTVPDVVNPKRTVAFVAAANNISFGVV